MMYIILAIVILLLMVTIHEFGHYIVGKLLKFKINEFSIGFGPKLFSRKNKKTQEVFSIRLLPLGGYCAFSGEDEITTGEKKNNSSAPTTENTTDSGKLDVFADRQEKTDSSGSEPTGSAVSCEMGKINDDTAAPVLDAAASDKSAELKNFYDQAPWKRILVLLAGAAFNFISAIIFAFIFLCCGGNITTVVMEKQVDDFGNEYNAELMVNDRIIKVNGIELNAINRFATVIAQIKGDTAVFTVIRDGETLDVSVVKQEIYDEERGSYMGFGFLSSDYAAPMNIGSALLYCIPYTLQLSWTVLGTLGQLLTGQLALTSLSGPVSTIKFMADAAQQHWLNIFLLLPLIASNLAIFNILPIPALDGSKIVFTIIEWIRGKPINRNIEVIISLVGLVLLLALCIVVELFHFIG